MARAFALLLVASVMLAAPAMAQDGGRIPVKVGVSGRPDQVSLELAMRRGYFAKEGLDVEYVQASSGEEMVPSLAADQIQVGSGSPNAGLFNALNRGIDIRMVADFAHVGPKGDRSVSVVARSDLLDSGTIKTPADLKGRSVGFGPGAGQVSEILFDTLFKKEGFTIKDVTVRFMLFSDSLAAMGSKSLDAAFLVEPLVTAAEQKNIARVLIDAGSIIPGTELSVWYYSPAFAKNKNAATKFMVGFLKGARDYHDAFFDGKGKDEAIKLLIQYLPVKDPALWQASRQFTDMNGNLNVDDLKRQAAFYKAEGLVTGPMPDVDAHVDTSFAEAAVKVLGAR
ncbi:MAG TPA: ABC transporter substrate-binding protein [Stellaceae bacterium]|nr:ABC transporter substrate-binding protein [Stellaceae bacterium]